MMGVEGTIEECIRYQGDLMAAGAEGIFRLEKEFIETYNQDKYIFKNYFPAQTWDLSVFEGPEDELIACLNEEVVAFDENGSLTSILECYPWTANQSSYHDSLLYIGTDPGFSVVTKSGASWNFLGEIREVEEPIDRIVEQNDSVIWLGTRSFGLYRLENLNRTDTGLSYDRLDYYEMDAGLPEGEVKPCRYEDRMLFSTAEGIYEVLGVDSFIPAEGVEGEAENSYIFKLNTSPSDQLWAIVPGENENRFGPLVSEGTGLQLWSKAFNPISSEIVYSFHFDGDSVVWLSGPNGVFRYEATQDYDYQQDFNTLIRKVSVNFDSVIFAGNFQNDSGRIVADQPKGTELELEHDINSFTFEYAAQAEAAPEKQQYSYFLEGFSKEWSKWKNEAKAVFTNLEPGDYVFKVKAKNIFDHESSPTEYRFSIAKPWWETPWYYLAQTLFFIVLIVLTVLLNRGEGQSKFAEIVALVTIITVFEFLIMIIEPMFEKYTGGVPVFQLAMNILLALSLNPAEAFIRKRLRKTKA